MVRIDRRSEWPAPACRAPFDRMRFVPESLRTVFIAPVNLLEVCFGENDNGTAREHGGRRAALGAADDGHARRVTRVDRNAGSYAADQLKGTGTPTTPFHTTDDLIDGASERQRKSASSTRGHLASWSRRHGAVGAVTDDVIDEMNHPDLQAAELDGNGHAIELQTSGEHGALQPAASPAARAQKVKARRRSGNVDRGDSAAAVHGHEHGDTSKDRQLKIEWDSNRVRMTKRTLSARSSTTEPVASIGLRCAGSSCGGRRRHARLQLGDTDRKGFA